MGTVYHETDRPSVRVHRRRASAQFDPTALADVGRAGGVALMEVTTMIRKFSMLLAAAAVLASVVPAMASASTGLTENGVLINVGSEVTMTNKGIFTTTTAKAGNIECGELMFLGKLTKN